MTELHLLEAFALAPDRAKALEQLIPGTEDHYFHSCLVAEQQGRLDEIDALLKQWNKRYGETQRFVEMRNRRMLLGYEKKPKDTLEYLRLRLDLQLQHERDVEGATSKLPTRLDPATLSRKEILAHGLRYGNASDLSGFTNAALDWLLDEDLEPQRTRAALTRIQRPDHPRLVDLIVADLAQKNAPAFGSLPIHAKLTQAQLDALLKQRSGLKTNDAFVTAYLQKLHPGPDVDWQNDDKEHEAFLDRLWTFVNTRGPELNALRAHVLYHRLDLDRRRGVYDRERFLEYLKLPRRVGYSNEKWLERFDKDEKPFAIGGDFRARTLHTNVGDDSELVRDYLMELLRDAKDTRPFDTYVSEAFIKQIFATTKMLAGVGDMEKWFTLADDAAYCQALKERVELAFARTNKTHFRADDPVSLAIDVKAVSALTVKVYEINLQSWFLANGRDVDTSIDLDGLVPSEEQTHEYTEPPLRRVRRTFDFPSLNKPGVYVIECIGGGISSRALIRKGRLRYVERMGSAGHAFTVLDEDRRALDGAALTLGGREYTARDGVIDVPYSTRPGRQTILLRHQGLCTVEAFEHQAEHYRLFAGLYVDRESLVKGKEATLVLRPSLRVNDQPASLALLEDVTLEITATDRDGVASSQTVRGPELSEDKETLHVFQVPEKLSHLALRLTARVDSVSQGKKIDLADGTSFALNGIERDAIISCVHLARTPAGFVASVLGKTGEAKPGTPVRFTLEHRHLVPHLTVNLQTDANGRAELGELPDIHAITAHTNDGRSERWELPRDRARSPGSIHARAGDTFVVPYMHRSLERADVSLLEVRGNTYVRDFYSALCVKDGYLEIAGLPAGDFELALKRHGTTHRIRAVPGEERAGWICGDKRHVQRRSSKPLQITNVREDKDEVVITLGNTNERTRVHVFATRFLPAYAAGEQLGRALIPEPRALELFKGASQYVSGRDIGDEYRYILERKRAKKHVGNTLARPGLLLNPWAMRTTETRTQDAKEGGAYGSAGAPAMAAMPKPAAPPAQPAAAPGTFASLDFLANPAATFLNLRPGKDGTVRVPKIAHASLLRVVAVDALATVVRDFPIQEATTPPEDLRMLLPLDPKEHFAERKQVTLLSAGARLDVEDITSAKIELYDTLARVHRLFTALSSNADLARFAFVLRWPALGEAERRTIYSEHACHELSFFIAKKDPEWFARVVQPYLRNKKDKTFLDHYLLADDLSAFTTPWAFGRLNIVERILLAQRIGGEGGPVARHAKDLADLTPRDVELFNRLFASALGGSALEAGDALGIGAQATEKTKAKKRALKSTVNETKADDMRPMMMARMPAPAAGPSFHRLKEEEANLDEAEEVDEPAPEEASEGFGGDDDGISAGERDRSARETNRPFFRQLDKTQEWAENNYWHLPIEQQVASLITISPFWRDYARHTPGTPFLSEHIAYAARSFAEMMLALSVLDLPFEAKKPKVVFDAARMQLTPEHASVVWHKEVKPVAPTTDKVPILVSQNYFRDDDRVRYVDDESVDNYVTGELLTDVIYACQIVLTNPTSSTQKLDVLLQLPTGAIPVKGAVMTTGQHVQLAPYATQTIEYAFYFPSPGVFAHFPVHVAKNEQLIAFAPATELRVVRELSTVDETSWAWLSQHGDDAAVLAWMEKNNLDRLVADGTIDRIAWRLRKKDFYTACIALLRARHVWSPTLFAYAVQHDDAANIRELLLHRDDFLDQCGAFLESELVRLDPVARHRYQHLEYAPLVNARTQKLGARREILNNRQAQQYTALLEALRYKPLDDEDRLALTYHLFLQDRVDEALAMLDSVNPTATAARLQHDYLCVYAELCRERPDAARAIAERHKDHPVDRWRNLFRHALAQLDEINGGATAVIDDRDREQRQANLAATEPDFELAVDKQAITLTVQNLKALRVSYYRMDIELLFSRQPFVQQGAGQFAFIKPGRSDEISVPDGKRTFTIDLPAELRGQNFVVEVTAAGKRKSQAFYAHDLSVQVSEGYGQVRVSRGGENGKPLPKTYVKVYGRMNGGDVRFYKDGYTDLRGVFDYGSLSTNELDQVERFALLVLHDNHGAMIREAAPPKR